jgi:hypothetical protein
MTAKLEFVAGGITFLVDVEIFDDNPAYVEDVNSVEILTPSGEYMLAQFDEKEFKDNFQDVLDEKAQEYMRDLAIAYAEARFDAQREEGL